MVLLIDNEELEKMESNPESIKLRLTHLKRIMQNECVGDMERLPYLQEYNRLKSKLVR